MPDRELVILLAEDDEGRAYLVQKNLLNAGFPTGPHNRVAVTSPARW
jgi:hypothetical protein